MPWNNLQLQRKRWKFLTELVRETDPRGTISPLGLFEHRRFSIMCKGLDYKQTWALKKEGFEINRISYLCDNVVSFDVSIPYDLEKKSEYVQSVAREIKSKSVDELYYVIARRYVDKIEKQLENLKKEHNLLQIAYARQHDEIKKKLENRTKTIRILAKRLLMIRGVENV